MPNNPKVRKIRDAGAMSNVMNREHNTQMREVNVIDEAVRDGAKQAKDFKVSADDGKLAKISGRE